MCPPFSLFDKLMQGLSSRMPSTLCCTDVVQHSKLGIVDAATYRDVYIKQEELKENLAFCAKSEYNKLIHYKHLRRI